MFEIGNTIIYGSQGVCRIADIENKEIGGKVCAYYVLKPVYQANNTIFVPVDNQVLAARMRKVLSFDEIEQLIHAIPDEETIWIEDDIQRRNKYQEIISSGDRRAIVRVIKTLYTEQKRRKECGKKLHQNDEQQLKKAETLLHNELAMVLNIKPEQVVPFLTEQIALEELK